MGATPITVPNASFESPGSQIQTSSSPDVVTGWVFDVKGGSAYGTTSISTNFAPVGTSDGSYAVFVNNDLSGNTDTITSAASLGQIAPLTTYTLTLAIGNRMASDASLYGAPGDVSFSLLANGKAFATTTVTNGTIPNGTFKDFTLTFTTPGTGMIIGQDLKIQLASLPQAGSAYQPAFDNVRLNATAVVVVPEPASGALLLFGLFMLGGLIWRTKSFRALLRSQR